jgi:hypothetical protein
MPALYPVCPCQVCNEAHALYYPVIGTVPDLRKPVI